MRYFHRKISKVERSQVLANQNSFPPLSFDSMVNHFCSSSESYEIIFEERTHLILVNKLKHYPKFVARVLYRWEREEVRGLSNWKKWIKFQELVFLENKEAFFCQSGNSVRALRG